MLWMVGWLQWLEIGLHLYMRDGTVLLGRMVGTLTAGKFGRMN